MAKDLRQALMLEELQHDAVSIDIECSIFGVAKSHKAYGSAGLVKT
jgi:hypothetical protein